jgi:hypothetical protein
VTVVCFICIVTVEHVLPSKNAMSQMVVFYLKKNRMARRHAPFDKKNMAPCIADVPFFISSNDP